MRSPAPTVLVVAVLSVPTVVLAQDDAYTLPEAAPVLARSALLREVSGQVLVREPGAAAYRPLSRRIEAIPMRSFVDARRGRVRVTVMRGPDGERTSSAAFFDGKFQITQQTQAPYITDLRLAGGLGLECDKARASVTPPDGGKKRRKRGRRLWGDGRGSFRTSGRYSAATVRGTRWLVEDRCAGTLTRVARGVVDVEDYSDSPQPEPTPTPPPVTGPQPPAAGGEDVAAPQERGGKRIRLRKGRSYLARPGR